MLMVRQKDMCVQDDKLVSTVYCNLANSYVSLTMKHTLGVVLMDTAVPQLVAQQK